MDKNLVLIVWVLCLQSIGLWIIVCARLVRGRPVLPVEKRGPVPWGLLDLLLLMSAVLLVQSALTLAWGVQSPAAGTSDMTADDKVRLLAASGVSRAVLIPLSAVLIWIRPGASLVDLGIRPRFLGRDVVLGVVAFLMVAPIVYGIQFVLVQWFPSEHPIVQWVSEDGGNRTLFWLCVFSAVFMAPIAEEYVYRLLLQGWMEKLAVGGSELEDVLTGRWQYEKAKETRRVPLWPVPISAALFAVMHLSHGPDPIPLFVLALALGLLYRNTHRIVPCILVHMLLNGVSMSMLVLESSGG